MFEESGHVTITFVPELTVYMLVIGSGILAAKMLFEAEKAPVPC